MGDKIRKAISFDLDTQKLKDFYPGNNYRDAYTDIQKFLFLNEFEHRQ